MNNLSQPLALNSRLVKGSYIRKRLILCSKVFAFFITLLTRVLDESIRRVEHDELGERPNSAA